jgi:undecaprenyl phosphate-alpha-L-ara4N flippase subunit ArnE
MNWIAWPALSFAIVLGTVGQLLLKYALRQSASSAIGLRTLLAPAMLGWLLCYAITTILWLLALRSIPLSQAFPILGLQFALIPIASSHWLDERITRLQWFGIIAIVAGVAMVGQS